MPTCKDITPVQPLRDTRDYGGPEDGSILEELDEMYESDKEDDSMRQGRSLMAEINRMEKHFGTDQEEINQWAQQITDEDEEIIGDEDEEIIGEEDELEVMASNRSRRQRRYVMAMDEELDGLADIIEEEDDDMAYMGEDDQTDKANDNWSPTASARLQAATKLIRLAKKLTQ